MTDSYPVASAFVCLEEKFKHGNHVFRKGNTYQIEDYPDIDQAELKMFFKQGWIQVEGWGDPPARDPNRVVRLDVHKSVIGQKAATVGE